jgi:hypothetical protein
MIFGLILWSTMDLDDGPQDVTLNDLAVTREVASIMASQAAESTIGGIAPLVMEIDCSDISERPPVTVKSHHLRIKTKGCKPLSIFNQNNDFEATLFELGQQSYSTDYISLAKGENQLVIMRDDGSNYPIAISLWVVSQ